MFLLTVGVVVFLAGVVVVCASLFFRALLHEEPPVCPKCGNKDMGYLGMDGSFASHGCESCGWTGTSVEADRYILKKNKRKLKETRAASQEQA